MSDEKLDALLEAVAENTTTLIDVQKQAAATSASAKDSRTYVQNIAKQTDWANNGKVIASVLTAAMEKDHTALHAASKAAQDMRSMSVEIAHRANVAAESQKDASERFHGAANRLLELQEAHEAGKWRRMGVIALIGALCGAVGFFAREPANKYEVLWEVRAALKENAHGPDCATTGGESSQSNGRLACVIWQDPS